MDVQRVDIYLMNNAKYFPTQAIPMVRDRLLALSDDRFNSLMYVEFKDPVLILVVSLLAGGLGIDRFMLGDIGLGVLKLLTFGVFGIFTIIDWFFVMNRAKELNLNNLMMAISR